MSILSNKEILKLAKSDPNYQSITSKLTDKIFTDTGFTEIATGATSAIMSEFFGLSVRIVLQKISQPRPRIPEVYKAVVEEYDNEYGGIFQRINTQPLKPTSPKFKNLVNGGSVDPFVIRKPETTERFYQQNFDWQNILTLQKKDLKKIFLAENGINEYVDGIVKSLNDSYNISKYETMRELLSKIAGDVNLQTSQRIEVPVITQSATQAQMIQFLQAINAVHLLFETTVMSKDFNKLKFEHGLHPDEYYLLVRGDVMANIKYNLNRVSYHIEDLGIKFKVKEVKDFGGLKYYNNSDVELKPIYDDFGANIGFNTTGEGTPLPDSEIKIVDPFENVQAMLVQRGIIFTTQQQPFEIESIYNPAGKYMNMWASQPNASFNIDSTYNVIIFEGVAETTEPSEPSEPSEP